MSCRSTHWASSSRERAGGITDPPSACRGVEDRRESFDRPGEALFGMWVGGQLVAVCGLNVDPYGGDHRIGRVRHLYVQSACRRLGVGRDLVTQAIGAARGHFDTLRLRTANPAAARLYEALGFRSTERTVADSTHVMELENAVSSPDTDKVFAGSIPKLYEDVPRSADLPAVCCGPGEPGARDLLLACSRLPPARVLSLDICHPCCRKASPSSPRI